LGVLENYSLMNHHLTVHPGDSLVFFTDGVTDIQSPDGKFFGDQRLVDVIQKHGLGTIQNMLEELDDALIEFRRGTPPADDITLLAVRREPTRSAIRSARKTKKPAAENNIPGQAAE
jgi:sigma-B regulation protein RsbU (phosphoserine phosphatase)